MRAINELRPRLGLELTATPFVETPKGPLAFRNIVQDYTLARAIADGFVKILAVVTRQNFNPAHLEAGELEQIKLEDGVRLHENVKGELATYALESGIARVKPFMLVIARDTTHAAALLALIESQDFFNGRYIGKAIQIDHTSEDLMIDRLLRVEQADEPTEIVIHVNMLKESWDVTNLYTIVPLRAANARTLIEQSIGRGLRLPFGRRINRKRQSESGQQLTDPVDRLNIVAHDRFQDIVDEANREGSSVRLMEHLLLTADGQIDSTRAVVAQPSVLGMLGIGTAPALEDAPDTAEQGEPAPIFASPKAQQIAAQTYREAQKLSREVARVPNAAALLSPEVQAQLVRAVEASAAPSQPALLDAGAESVSGVDVAAVVRQATEILVAQTISIPRISVTPLGEVRTLFAPFTLDLSGVSYRAGTKNLVIQNLSDNAQEWLGADNLDSRQEPHLPDQVVSLILNNPEVNYDDNSDMLYALADQVIAHFEAQELSNHEIKEVLSTNRRTLSRLIFAQMRLHQHTPPTEYERVVRQGFTELRPSTLTAGRDGVISNPQQRPPTGAAIATCIYTGFARSLYASVKFQSDAERLLGVILDRDAQKWFRPVLGQF